MQLFSQNVQRREKAASFIANLYCMYSNNVLCLLEFQYFPALFKGTAKNPETNGVSFDRKGFLR
jgi:hypothetical protein